MTAETTRRALIGGAGIAAVAAAISALPIAARVPARSAEPIRPEFQAAYDAISAADRIAREHGPVYEAARERYVAAEAQVPHVTFASVDELYGPATYTTADAGSVRASRILVNAWRDEVRPRKVPGYTADARKLVAADMWRNRKLAQLRRSTGLAAARDQDNANGAAIVDAEDAFLHMPVTNVAELALKVRFLDERGCWGHHGVSLAIHVDVAQLVAQEGR